MCRATHARLFKMNLSRHKRKLLALFGVWVMLFAQLAMAAHACMEMEPAQVISVAGELDHESGSCHEGDPGVVNACLTYCQAVVQASPDTQFTPGAALMPVLAYSIARQDLPPAIISDQGYAQALLKRVTAPPAMVRNCCLRI